MVNIKLVLLGNLFKIIDRLQSFPYGLHPKVWGKKNPQCDFCKIRGRTEALEVPFVLGLSISERNTSVSVDVISSAKTLLWNSQVY